MEDWCFAAEGLAISISPNPGFPVEAAPAEVLAHAAVNAEYRHLVLAAGAPAAAARPGQFFQLLCPAAPGTPAGEAPFLRRPMSLYGADPARGRVEFLYKVAGAGTRGLATLRPGDRLDMLGPLGRGFRLDPAWRHIAVVARGAGLATLAPLLREARAAGIGVTAVLSARSPALLVSEPLFRSLGAEVVAVTDSDGSSDPAAVEALLRGLIAAGRCEAFFTCGSARLLRLQQRLAREHGLPGQVALEQQMACGLGMCFCCVRDFHDGAAVVHKRVCWDGPVFGLLEAVA
jgi:dihydroorotate dehydrogenase electron transfer subunit